MENRRSCAGGVVAILTAQHPVMSIYILVFNTAAERFVKLFLLFLFCFLGCVLSVMIAFAEKPDYNPSVAFVRALSILVTNSGYGTITEYDSSLSVIAHLLFLLLLLLPIIYKYFNCLDRE